MGGLPAASNFVSISTTSSSPLLQSTKPALLKKYSSKSGETMTYDFSPVHCMSDQWDHQPASLSSRSLLLAKPKIDTQYAGCQAYCSELPCRCRRTPRVRS